MPVHQMCSRSKRCCTLCHRQLRRKTVMRTPTTIKQLPCCQSAWSPSANRLVWTCSRGSSTTLIQRLGGPSLWCSLCWVSLVQTTQWWTCCLRWLMTPINKQPSMLSWLKVLFGQAPTTHDWLAVCVLWQVTTTGIQMLCSWYVWHKVLVTWARVWSMFNRATQTCFFKIILDWEDCWLCWWRVLIMRKCSSEGSILVCIILYFLCILGWWLL